jgi:1-acyl-sn-glycerol-3-phosphate acyltransferase
LRRLLQRLALYAFQVFVARPVLKWVVGVRYRRLGLVPDGPCLVVSNHNSHLDAAVLMTMFPLRRLAHVHPVAAADYFGSSWFMSMMALLLMNGIPISRRPVRGEDPLTPLVELLKSGETLIFFPEGSRGEAGVVARFRAGVGKLVQQVPGLLVVPVFLSGPERIWPRGEIVPVPLSIDANIGRPRTYEPTVDARAIAEQVRDDVLNLAPPPPPIPGERPAPPTRVAICSVDERQRSELFRRVVERLGRTSRTLGVAETVIEADAAGVREATAPVPVGRERAWLGLLAAVFRTGGKLRGPRFAEAVERARVLEVLNQGRDTGFVVEDGSVLVDLLASGRGDLAASDERTLRQLFALLAGEKTVPVRDWWRWIRLAREVWLVSVFNLVRPPVPEILVCLHFPVPLVAQRLRSRGEALGPHENERELERLQRAYADAAEVLRKRRRVEILDLDGAAAGLDETAERIEKACLALVAAMQQATDGR